MYRPGRWKGSPADCKAGKLSGLALKIDGAQSTMQSHPQYSCGLLADNTPTTGDWTRMTQNCSSLRLYASEAWPAWIGSKDGRRRKSNAISARITPTDVRSGTGPLSLSAATCACASCCCPGQSQPQQSQANIQRPQPHFPSADASPVSGPSCGASGLATRCRFVPPAPTGEG